MPRNKPVSSWIDEETGDVIELYIVNGKGVMLVYHEDGSMEEWHESNPSPDDDGKGTGKPDVAELLKHAHAAYKTHKNAEDTPLGKWITGGGKGRDAHWNPGDGEDDQGPGSAPDHSHDYDKTAKQRAQELRAQNMQARARHIIGTSMGSGDEGGSEEAPGPGNHGSSKGNSSDQGSYKDHQNKTVGDTQDIGPRPDLVNPDPTKRTEKVGRVG